MRKCRYYNEVLDECKCAGKVRETDNTIETCKHFSGYESQHTCDCKGTVEVRKKRWIDTISDDNIKEAEKILGIISVIISILDIIQMIKRIRKGKNKE